MGLRGPAPTPTAVKRLRGTDKPSRTKNEPKPPLGAKPPDWLEGEGLAEFKRLAPQLVAMKLLTEWDRALFVAWCATWGRYVDLSRKVAEDGEIIVEVGEKGYRQVSPEISELRKTLGDLVTLSARFGFSPADRTRIDVRPPRPGEDEGRWILDGDGNPFLRLSRGKAG